MMMNEDDEVKVLFVFFIFFVYLLVELAVVIAV